MKTKVWAVLGFKFGAAFLVVSAVFLALYFFKPRLGSKKEPKRQVRWVILSGCSYLLALGAYIVVVVTYFSMYIPNMGDFNSVSWQGGNMTAGNNDGEFEMNDEVESMVIQNGRPCHRIVFTLKNDFDSPVTLQAFKVVSRMDDKDLEGYQSTIKPPLSMQPNESRAVTLQAEYSDRIREHAKKENLDEYGLTAYLQVVTSQGKLPGIPLHFPDQWTSFPPLNSVGLK